MHTDPSETTQQGASCDSAEALEQMADRHFMSGDLAQALQRQSEALQCWQQMGDLAREADCSKNAGYLQFLLNDYTAALASYEHALELCLCLEDVRGAAVALGRLADVKQHLGEHGAALVALERALELCKKSGNRRDMGTVLNNIGVSFRELGKLEEATQFYETSLSIRREINDLEGLAATLHNLGSLCLDQSMFNEAGERLEEARRLRDNLDDKTGLGRTMLCLGRLYETTDDLDRAEKCYEEARQLATLPANRSAEDEAAALHNLGGAAIAKGDYVKALVFLEQAHSIVTDLNIKPSLAMTLYNLAVAHRFLDHPRSALKCLAEAKTVQEQIDDHSGLANTLTAMGFLFAECGEQAQAYEILTSAVRLLDNLAEHETQAAVFKILGRVCAAQGKSEEAVRHNRSAAFFSASKDAAGEEIFDDEAIYFEAAMINAEDAADDAAEPDEGCEEMDASPLDGIGIALDSAAHLGMRMPGRRLY